MVKEQISISTGAFKVKNLERIFAAAVKYDFKNIELSSGVPLSKDLLKLVYDNQSDFDFLIHNYFPPHKDPFVLNLAANEPLQLTRSREHCFKAIDLTGELGGGFYSVHCGFAFKVKPEMLGVEGLNYSLIPLEEAKATFKESLKLIVEYAKAKGIMLLIENNVISQGNLMEGENLLGLGVTADDLLEYIEEINSPALGLLIDVGHLKVSANSLRFDPLRFIERIKDHVRAFHLSDNNGLVDENLPFDESAWFMSFLRDFPRATFIIEAYNLNASQIVDCKRAIFDCIERGE